MSIAVENEYKLGPLVASDVVIDIGAHIGAFSHLARRMGSKNIYAFEIDPWHTEAALMNLREGLVRRKTERGEEADINLMHVAVVRGDEHRANQYYYNGAWNAFGVVGTPVQSISLDEILAPHESVRLVKIDCEGGEWPILYTCTNLAKVQEIVGEYHTDERLGQTDSSELQNLPYPIDKRALMSFLYGQGFQVHIEPTGENIGLFWAKRQVKPGEIIQVTDVNDVTPWPGRFPNINAFCETPGEKIRAHLQAALGLLNELG